MLLKMHTGKQLGAEKLELQTLFYEFKDEALCQN